MSAPASTALGLRKATQAQNGPAQTKKLVIKPLKSEERQAPSQARSDCLARRVLGRRSRSGGRGRVCLRATCAARPELPSDFEEVTWGKLREAVHAVFHKQPVARSLEELFSVRSSPRGGGAHRRPREPCRPCFAVRCSERRRARRGALQRAGALLVARTPTRARNVARARSTASCCGPQSLRQSSQHRSRRGPGALKKRSARPQGLRRELRRAPCSLPHTCSQAVQDMCMHRMADKLYSRLQQVRSLALRAARDV